MIGPLSTDLAPAPTLVSERLAMRPLCPGDAEAIAALAGDRRVARNLADVPSPFPVPMAMSWVTARLDRWARGGGPTYAITERSAGPGLIGTISMRSVPRDRRAELGYWLGYASWGRGLASEAVHRLLYWAFVESNLHRVYAQVIADNRRSHRVLQKAGMSLEGTRRGHLRKGRRFVDVDEYGVLRDEWLHRHQASASEAGVAATEPAAHAARPAATDAGARAAAKTATRPATETSLDAARATDATRATSATGATDTAAIAAVRSATRPPR